MPIYEYRCEDCGERFEKLVLPGRQTAGEVRCPACGGVQVQRLMSAAAIRSSGPDAGQVEAQEPGPSPPILGRKELKAAQEEKTRLRDEATST
jgi:putative FmdB family regulatory protein